MHYVSRPQLFFLSAQNDQLLLIPLLLQRDSGPEQDMGQLRGMLIWNSTLHDLFKYVKVPINHELYLQTYNIWRHNNARPKSWSHSQVSIA